MKELRRVRWLCSAVLLSSVLCCGAGAQQTEPLRAAHDALFASFLPIDELANDAGMMALLAGARDRLWTIVSSDPQLRTLEGSFEDLRSFHGACGIGFTGEDHAVTFAELSSVQRRELLQRLESCDANGPRSIATAVRTFYIVRGYEAIQEPLSGERLRLFAPPAYVAAHRPVLPPTRLVYDAKDKDLRERDGHAIDVLIVGSGPAGSVLAHELRRGGKRVVLLERGSFLVPGAMDTRLVDGLLDNKTTVDGGIRVHNGVAVGGGSAVNVDLCFAPTSDEIRTKIEGWRRAGNIAPQEFTQAELAREYAWVKREIGTRQLNQREINANNRVLWDGAEREGLHPKLYELNTYAPGGSPSPVTDKRSAEDGLLLEALKDKVNPLGMVPDADVSRVLFDEVEGEQRAVGVEVKARVPWKQDGVIADPNALGIAAGESYTVHAKTVILAAGSLGSPTVLLRSGVHNDQIGRGVILHPSMPVMGLFDHTIDALSGTEASVYVDDRLTSRGYAFESMAAEPVYAALMSPGPPMHAFEMVQRYRNLAGFGVMLIDTPRPENRLVLDTRGEPQISYAISDDDKRRFAEGVAEAVRIMFRAGAKEVYLPTTEDILGKRADSEMEPSLLQSIDQASLVERNLHFVAGRSVVTSAHMQATDKMGSTAADSVVGYDFHVWGTRALYVVDGSVFPTSVGANPMQSIYTVAKVFADHWDGEQEQER
jgi:choline dehydrogenase-like flavoprotein